MKNIFYKTSNRYFGFLIIVFYLPGLSNFAYSQNLNPGDGIRISFFNNPDNISGDYFIQKDYSIQFPFIGAIQAKEKSFKNIRVEIIEKYKSIYHNPELTALPLYKINVLGEVHTPRVYFVTGVERLSDLLAMAGGETQDANLNKLYFIRNGQRYRINARKILENGSRLNDLGLKSGDQIYVPQKRWLTFRNASAIISGVALIITAVGVVYR
jgi:protein involved in polysaccharide export with SLBB domain